MKNIPILILLILALLTSCSDDENCRNCSFVTCTMQFECMISETMQVCDPLEIQLLQDELSQLGSWQCSEEPINVEDCQLCLFRVCGVVDCDVEGQRVVCNESEAISLEESSDGLGFWQCD